MAKKSLPRVTGFGGLFFKAKNQEALSTWYREKLGLPIEDWGGCVFPWRDAKDPKKAGQTVWSVFDAKSPYFKPSRKNFMMNFRVDDLDRVLAELQEEGVEATAATEESEFGKFGWLMDPEGNKIELWQPPAPVKKKKPKKSKTDKKSKKKKKLKKSKE